MRLCLCACLALIAEGLPLNRLNRYCAVLTGQPGSYCKARQPPLLPACKGVHYQCTDDNVEAWEQAVIIADRFSVFQLDEVCRQDRGSYLSICDISSYTCTETQRDCSPLAASPPRTRAIGMPRRNLERVQAVSEPYRDGGVRRTEPVSEPCCDVPDERGVRRAKSIQFEAVPVITTTTPPPRTFIATSDLTDKCGMHGAIFSHRAPQGNSFFLLLADLKECLQSLRISNAHALWTLHNLRFGIAETYSFTNLATNTRASEHANVCGHTVHAVEVDLVSEFTSLIAEHTDNLTETRNALAFHTHLMNLMNRLHDAHTMYSMPFEMFKIFAPISFGSRMVPKRFKDGSVKLVQVVTLRMSTEEPDDPFEGLVRMYRAVHHMDEIEPRVEGLGIPYQYADQEIVKINDKPALQFLYSLVQHNGPFAGMYTQAEQRLNAFVFSVPLLAFSPLLGPLPSFNSLTLTMADKNTFKVKLMGQFTQLSDAPDLRSREALEHYVHSNEAFNAFVKLDTNAQSGPDSLWVRAATAATTEIAPADEERVADVWGDPVVHARRDSLLVAAMVEAHPELNMAAAVEQIELKSPTKCSQRSEKNTSVFGFTNTTAHFSPQKPSNSMMLTHPDTRFTTRSAIPTTLHGKLHERDTSALQFGKADLPEREVGWHIVDLPQDEKKQQIFSKVGNLEYLIKDDTVIVRVPSMDIKPTGDVNFESFPEMFIIQQRAVEIAPSGLRLLFDVSGNSGGLIKSAYALQWYVTPSASAICAPLRKRLSPDWQLWLSSFGGGLDALVQKHMVPKGSELLRYKETIFSQIEALTILLYDGLGYGAAQIGPTKKNGALARIRLVRAEIEDIRDPALQAAAIVDYIRSRGFLPPQMPNDGADILPIHGFEPFHPDEMLEGHFHAPEEKKWGVDSAHYSRLSEYAFCREQIAQMPAIVPGYRHNYWRQIAFVSDGTCGSACALFLQGIQFYGQAVGFSYGGLANTAMDVGSFAGGNVEEYKDFWPKLAFGAKVAHLASLGESAWSQKHINSWIAMPIPFPTKARVKFNRNMMFSRALGPHALPRQFYLIPARKHLNLWAATRAEKEPVYEAIVKYSDWNAIPPQFHECTA